LDGWTPPKGGFLSRWLDIAEKMTWLPESWKLTSGMMTLSCTVGTRVFVQPGARMFRPNLYVMLIGESGSGKGTAIHDLTERMVRDTVGPGFSVGTNPSPEGIMAELAKREKGGEGALFQDELETIVSDRAYQRQFPRLMTELYNSNMEAITVTLVSEKRVVRRPYLCAFVGIQPKTLDNVVKESALSMGFFPRFVLDWGETKPEKAVIRPDAEWRALRDDLGTSTACLSFFERPVELPAVPGALELLRELIRESRGDDAMELVDARRSELVLKLATLLAMDRWAVDAPMDAIGAADRIGKRFREPRALTAEESLALGFPAGVTAEAIGEAFRLYEYVAKFRRRFFSYEMDATPDGVLMGKMIRAMDRLVIKGKCRDGPPGWKMLYVRDVRRAVPTTTTKLLEMLNALKAMNYIGPVEKVNTGGDRPAQMVFYREGGIGAVADSLLEGGDG